LSRIERISVWLLFVSLLFTLAGSVLALRPKLQDASCLRNLGRIGAATHLYCQDFDGLYPMAYTSIRWPQFTTYNWSYRLEPYLLAGASCEQSKGVIYSTGGGKKGEVSLGWANSGGITWHCPADTTGSNISYGTNPFVSGAEELQEDGVRKPTWQSSLMDAEIVDPSITLWAGDTTKEWHEDANEYYEVYADWMRAANLPKRHGKAMSFVQMSDWYSALLEEDDTNIRADCPRPGGYGCKGPSYWHNRSGDRTGAAGMVFCDGHAALMPFGAIKVEMLFANSKESRP
jgi:prepilin-type processing-associated H-X9-DG protein